MYCMIKSSSIGRKALEVLDAGRKIPKLLASEVPKLYGVVRAGWS